MPKIHVVLLAAGSGSRMGGLPKQLRLLGGCPLFVHSLRTFLKALPSSQMTVMMSDDHQIEEAEKALGAFSIPAGRLSFGTGGQTRAHSVRNALGMLNADPEDLVLIHDTARPLVTEAVILRVVAALHDNLSVTPAVCVADSVRRTNGPASAPVRRDGLKRVQTPQGFRFAALRDAHDRFSHSDYTDDVSITEAAGIEVAIVEGDEMNFKVTWEDDLRRAERLLSGHRVKHTVTGHGFDVHRLGAERKLVLCGVEVPHSSGLIGHSDADVGLHALTDAILGAVGLGDIGQHFSPKDVRWKNADSSLFLRHAVEVARDAGFEMIQTDITLICEEPRIGPYRDMMVELVRRLTGAQIVSVKATTTEMLGFTGRREGIAALATATLEGTHDRG